MKNKFIICLSALLCLGSLLTACGGNDSESTAKQENSLTSAENSLVVPSIAISKKKSGDESPSEVALPTAKPFLNTAKIKVSKDTTYNFDDKIFSLDGCGTSLTTEKGWELKSGGNGTEFHMDMITSYPAVMQYNNTKNTITVTVEEGCEDEEAFLAGTKETYIEAYGKEFESLDITDFEQISIDAFDSFKVVADVVISGEKYEMTHIISNDVSEKTISWMMLDNDGSLKDFDIVEGIKYPVAKALRKNRENKFDTLYRWDNDKKEAVKID